MRSIASTATEATRASSSNFCSACAAASASGMAASGLTVSAIAASTAGAASSPSGAGTRSMREAAVFGSGPARQLDTAKPAIRQFGDDCPGFIEQGNVGGRRPRADARDTQPGAVRNPSERGRRTHPPETPRQKTRASKIAAMPGLLVGDQRQQPLQRAVEQRGMNNIRRERLVDDRRIELRRRLSGAEQLDAPHGAEPAAVIEPEPGGEPIERGGVHFPASRFGRAEQRRRNEVAGRRQSRHGVQGRQVVGETRAARQFPIPVLADFAAADLAGPPVLEGQRPAQLDIADIDRRRHPGGAAAPRPAPSRRPRRPAGPAPPRRRDRRATAGCRRRGD